MSILSISTHRFKYVNVHYKIRKCPAHEYMLINIHIQSVTGIDIIKI